ncbi:MAG: 5-deoxy-glucuronate isomerase [Actinobacteria bacterium]|nr:5-deoxy-glucuronate isomerase [Actinomycetota bacterium]
MAASEKAVPARQGPVGAGRLHWPAGSLARGPWELEVTQATAGWSWASLRVLALPPGGSHSFSTGEEEMVLLPLEGGCALSCSAERFELAGRPDVFSGPSDFAYLPVASDVEVSSRNGGRFALAGAKASRRLSARHSSAEGVAVEVRGAGPSSRKIANYCMPGTFEADRLMACEVLTPGGNWSSWPPHKHDEERPGEALLEEIYYFGVAKGPAGREGVAYQRVYGTPQRPVEVLAEVRDRDVVLVPHGYHGPSVAAPGYDLYYLNVMAGPGERAWLVSFDPAHEWVRASWEGQEVDPRVKVAGAGPR